MYCVNEGQGIMVCSLPIEAAFSRFATRYVDDAFGAATAWNYYLAMCSYVLAFVTKLKQHLCPPLCLSQALHL